MNLKKRTITFVILFLTLFFFYYKLITIDSNKNSITGMVESLGSGGTAKGWDADVADVKQMQGATTTPEGIIDVTKSPGTNRILTPTDTSISPLKTNLGTISNAKLENHAFNLGDLVQGKITSFTDDNLISMKSMFDPDLRVDIIMGKDGWAKIKLF